MPREAEFVEQSTLIDLLEKARAQRVGDFENSSENPLGQGVEVLRFIDVHRRPHLKKCVVHEELSNTFMGRR
jgi:hypothetical protein